MDNPTERRATRLVCLVAIIIGAIYFVVAVRSGISTVAVLAGLIVAFAVTVLVITNRAAKR